MRPFLALIIALLLPACSWNQTAVESADKITKTGLIVAKQAIPRDEIKKSERNVSTSIFGSIFSGGRISIGLGFLFSPSGDNDKADKPIRYEVKTLDDSKLTVYSNDDDFGVDDCVSVTILREQKKHPPEIKHENKAACSSIR